MTSGLSEATRERLVVEVAGINNSTAALEHVRQRRKGIKDAAEKDEGARFPTLLAEPLCHGAHHTFDGILHVLKAKTSKMQGEAEWKDILKARLENTMASRTP